MDVLSGFYKKFFSSKTWKEVAGRFAITTKIDTGEILEAFELASKLGKIILVILKPWMYYAHALRIFACSTCKISYKRPRPALFSFNFNRSMRRMQRIW